MKRKLVVGLLVTCSVLLGACGNNKTENVNTEVAEEVVNETKNEIETESVEEIEATEVEEIVVDETEVEEVLYTYSDLDKTMYAKQSVNVRDLPSTDGNKLGGLEYSQEVKVTGQCNETSWYRIEYQDRIAYVSNNYLLDEKPVEVVETPSQAPAQSTAQASGLTWYDDAGFYYCMSSSRDWYDGAGVKNTYYTGYVLAPATNFKIIIDDYSLAVEASQITKDLANTGYYIPVYDYASGRYCMIIENGDQFEIYAEQLGAFATQNGGTLIGASGGYTNIQDTNGNYAYFIGADIAY